MTHPSFKEEFNPSVHLELESIISPRRGRSPGDPPTPSPSPPLAPVGTGSAPNSSVRGSDVGKKQRHKEKLKSAGLDNSDSSSLTESGDEMGASSPPPQGPSGPGTEVGTEAGEEGDVEMAERSSPGGYFHCRSGWVLFHSGSCPRTIEPAPAMKPTKSQKAPKKGTFTRTRSSVAATSSRTTKKRKR